MDGKEGTIVSGESTGQSNYSSATHKIEGSLSPAITVDESYTLSWNVGVPIKEIKVNGTIVKTKCIKKVLYTYKWKYSKRSRKYYVNQIQRDG